MGDAPRDLKGTDGSYERRVFCKGLRGLSGGEDNDERLEDSGDLTGDNDGEDGDNNGDADACSNNGDFGDIKPRPLTCQTLQHDIASFDQKHAPSPSRAPPFSCQTSRTGGAAAAARFRWLHGTAAVTARYSACCSVSPGSEISHQLTTHVTRHTSQTSPCPA